MLLHCCYMLDSTEVSEAAVQHVLVLSVAKIGGLELNDLFLFVEAHTVAALLLLELGANKGF